MEQLASNVPDQELGDYRERAVLGARAMSAASGQGWRLEELLR